jgi:hypothetical protein
MEPNQRKQGPAGAGAAGGRALAPGAGVTTTGTCMSKDVYCEADDRLRGADRWVHRAPPAERDRG